jgi:hypothetical protein
MIKIVADAKDRLEVEGETAFYDASTLDTLRMKLNKKQKIEDPKFDFLKKHRASSPCNSFNIGKRSIALENDMLESERETIKSAFFRRKEELQSRSLVEMEKEDMKESEGGGSKTNLFFLKEAITDVSPLKLTKKGKIYINRRNLFFDKDGNFLKQ